MDPTKVWRKRRATILQWVLRTVKTSELTIFSMVTFDLDLFQLIVSNNAIVTHGIGHILIILRFFLLKLINGWTHLLCVVIYYPYLR